MLYVGTEHGVVTLKSEQAGAWSVENRALAQWTVPAVAASAAAPNRVVAGTRGDGVWVSQDCGQTWKKPNYGKPGPGKVRAVTLDPRDGERVYAGGEPIDVFRSPDSGQTWERLASMWDMPCIAEVTYPAPGVEPHVRQIAVDPNDTDVMYACLQVGSIAKTIDGGRTWELLEKGVDADVHVIVVDPTDSNTLYASTGGHDHRQGRSAGKALYKSTDAGVTWTPLAMEFHQEYSVPLAMDPTNPKVLFSALAVNQPNVWRRSGRGPDARLIRTEDGGETWESLSKGLPEDNSQYPEAISLDSRRPEHVYIGMKSGELYESRDGGDAWAKVDIELPPIESLVCVEA